MIIKHFKYQRKKDNQTNNYLVLVFKEDNEYINGIDLGELDKNEIEQVVEIKKNFEATESSWIKKAAAANMSVKDYTNGPEVEKEVYEYSTKIKPYMDKGYKKFLKSNIKELYEKDEVE